MEEGTSIYIGYLKPYEFNSIQKNKYILVFEIFLGY
jgi:hypothetical protein